MDQITRDVKVEIRGIPGLVPVSCTVEGGQIIAIDLFDGVTSTHIDLDTFSGRHVFGDQFLTALADEIRKYVNAAEDLRSPPWTPARSAPDGSPAGASTSAASAVQ